MIPSIDITKMSTKRIDISFTLAWATWPLWWKGAN